MNGYINNKQIKTENIENKTLLDILADNSYTIDAPCGGRGVCGKCKVKVEGKVTELTKKEKDLLTEKEISDCIRLACHCKPLGDFSIFVDSSSYEINTNSSTSQYEIYPNEFVKNFVKERSKAFGIAIDIGTTTVAAVFFDLITGEKLHTTSGINAQKTYGADVISRIGYSINNEKGGEALSNAIISQINDMILASGIDKNQIAKIVIAGNTTMQLLAAGLSINTLGALPFEPLSYFGEYFSAKELGYCTENAQIYFLPCCGGFFGGDAVACMLYSHFDEGGLRFIADIGTNGELALVCDDKIYGCSTAAGPAFEGACIRFGTGSVGGAINGVSENDGKFELKTIGNAPPTGICGSGLIDLTAICLNKEIIDESGRIEDDADEFEGENAIKVCDGIYLTQKDVREIQLAKSALCAGSIVLDGMISPKKIPEVYIAGGFGSAINLENAATIGLLPKSYCENAIAVGNAALSGAIMVLLSENCRETAEKIKENVEIVDLSTNPVFLDEYVENMIFEL